MNYTTINLHLGDCLPAMRQFPDRAFDLAIVDPVYGIDGNSSRKGLHKGKLAYLTRQYDQEIWKQEPPPQEYFDQLFRISKHQIIWGINYFVGSRDLDLKIGPGRIVWDKCNPGTSYSDCEIAYCSKITSVRLFRYMWNGMMQGKSIAEGHIKIGDTKKNEVRIHPTQKPKKLYSYLLQQFAEPGDKIIDTHCGSGTMLRAAYDLGFPVEAYEIHPGYYAEAKKEFDLYRSQIKVPLSLDRPMRPPKTGRNAVRPIKLEFEFDE